MIDRVSTIRKRQVRPDARAGDTLGMDIAVKLIIIHSKQAETYLPYEHTPIK
jgi:hypothetical protein